MFQPQEARLPTYLWVEAEIRCLSGLNVGVYVLNRGDKARGLVIQKISNLSGQCRLLIQQRNLLGELVWINALQDDLVDEGEADSYIKRSVVRDPDVWVVEIEDRDLKMQIY